VSKEKLNLGKSGEEIAAEFLKENGYKILSRNYKTKFGEIDIVAIDSNTTCFVEVKARSSDKFGVPFEAVTGHKQKQISKVALQFIKENKLQDAKARFDIVSVVCSGWPEKPKIELIKNAFELDDRFL
jgi:putative endonuclease